MEVSMMNQSKEQTQISELLKAGLWGIKPDTTLFAVGEADWLVLLKLAKQQACIGVAYDGMLTLPKELQPTRALFLQWSSLVAQIETDNEFLNERLREVVSLYREQGLSPALLKGQGVAQHYPHPEHRQSGDIDLLVGEGFEKANGLLRTESDREGKETDKHIEFSWRGVTVENHRISARLSHPCANAFYQKITDSWFPDKGVRISIGDFDVTVPPHEFNAAFLLVHALEHLFSSGLGMRQVMDWVCLMQATHSCFDGKEYNRQLRKTRLTGVAKAFASIGVNFMGLPVECLPFDLNEKDKKTGQKLLRRIWADGNFGLYNKERTRPKGYWAGKWHTFTSSVSRCAELFSMAPAEACCYPIRIAVNSAWEQIKMRL